jgi:hypothetical protein
MSPGHLLNLECKVLIPLTAKGKENACDSSVAENAAKHKRVDRVEGLLNSLMGTFMK